MSKQKRGSASVRGALRLVSPLKATSTTALESPRPSGQSSRTSTEASSSTPISSTSGSADTLNGESGDASPSKPLPVPGIVIYGQRLGTDENAIAHYRIVTPFRGLARCAVNPVYLRNRASVEEQNEAALQADIHLNHGILTAEMLSLYRQKVRPTTIFSIDDWLQRIHPTNPAYCWLGTELPDGTPLKGEDDVGINGQLVWEVGKDYGDYHFDPSANHVRRSMLESLTRDADGCLVTCERLAQVQRDVGSKNVFILPNLINPDDYPRVELAEHDEVRILWQGGDSHYVDWYPIMEGLKRVLLHYPQAHLYLFGAKFESITKHIPEGRWTFIDWVPYSSFILRLSTIGHDINLCPLTRTDFNEAKTAIKFYESSAITRPAVTLAGNYGPYAREIIDNETGLLYNTVKQFEASLSLLIEDAAARKQLAAAAKEWVHEHRTLDDKHILPYYDWLQATHADSCSRRGQPRRRVAQPRQEEPPKLVVPARSIHPALKASHRRGIRKR